jgi:hypothetical protein
MLEIEDDVMDTDLGTSPNSTEWLEERNASSLVADRAPSSLAKFSTRILGLPIAAAKAAKEWRVKKEMTDLAEAPAENWAVFRSQSSTEAQRRADAEARIDVEPAARATRAILRNASQEEESATLRSETPTGNPVKASQSNEAYITGKLDHLPGARSRSPSPGKLSEANIPTLHLTALLDEARKGVQRADAHAKTAGVSAADAEVKLEPTEEPAVKHARDIDDPSAVVVTPRDAPAVNKPEFAAVDFAKERLAKKVLADSSEGASNNWAVFRAEASTAAGDATRRVLDAEDAAAAPGKWSVFRSQAPPKAMPKAPTEAMRKVDDATTPRDTPAVKTPEVVERSATKQVALDSVSSAQVASTSSDVASLTKREGVKSQGPGARVAAGWEALAGTVLALPNRLKLAGERAAKGVAASWAKLSARLLERFKERVARRVKGAVAEVAAALRPAQWTAFRAGADPGAEAIEADVVPRPIEADLGAGAMRQADAKRRAEADEGKLQEPEVVVTPRAAAAVSKPEFAAVDFAKERLAKKVLADSSEGVSNNWAVFSAEAPTAAMQQGDATRRVLDTSDATASSGNWSVFRSQAPTEAMRKVDDATTPRDTPAVKTPKVVERSATKQGGARVAFAWAKLSARILAVPQRVIVAAAEAAKERRLKRVLADSSEGVSNNWAVLRAEAPTEAMQQADAALRVSVTSSMQLPLGNGRCSVRRLRARRCAS